MLISSLRRDNGGSVRSALPRAAAAAVAAAPIDENSSESDSGHQDDRSASDSVTS